jgi:hypothetical protein
MRAASLSLNTVKTSAFIIATMAISLMHCSCIGQTLNGFVVSKLTGEPLPFAAIIEQGTVNGVYSDIDGRYEILLTDTANAIQINLVGYESLYFARYTSVPAVISLTQQPTVLAEITIRPGINPAERIIQKAIDNKDFNNPEGNTPFTYNSYNKLIFGAVIDSTFLRDTLPSTLDTNARNAINFFKQQHLFMMESVTERKFHPPGHNEETILANRVSGLKNTELFLLGTQLQSFSFYGEAVELLGAKYMSPLAKNAINKYYFELEDTTYIGADTVFAISFRPRTKKNFPSMSGHLYINTNGYAIQLVVAEPKQEGKVQLKIQQQYSFYDNRQWFPMQLNSTILFDSTFSAESFPLVGEGRSYIKNIVLGAPLKPSDFSPVTLQINPDAEKADDALWEKYRGQSLTGKELKTYHVIDSVGKELNLDRRLKAIEALTTGEVALGYVNFDLKKLLAFNQYEGFRLGGGLRTNHRISNKFNTGIYAAYGFKDGAWKYGGDAIVHLIQKRNAWLKLEYNKDVWEMGGNGIRITDSENFFNQNIYRLFISRMDRRELLQASLNGRIVGNVTATAFLNTQYIQSYAGYSFLRAGNDAVSLTDSNYRIMESGMTIRYAPGEKLMRTQTREIRLGGHFPIFYFQFTRGLTGKWQGEYAYNRMDARIEKTFNFLNVGKLSVTVLGGHCQENVPLSLLYNAQGTYEKLTIVAPGSFQTMRVNEFMHSRFAAFHLRHAFRPFHFFNEKFKPSIAIAHSMLWGEFKNYANHNFTSSQANKGYVESGIQIDNLIVSGFSGIGLGVYYRYGYYALPAIQENIAVKISTSITF